MNTELAAKRRLLGKVLANALRDTAKIDESVLVASVVQQLQAPHVATLAVLLKVWRESENEREHWVGHGHRRPGRAVSKFQNVGLGQPAIVLTSLASLGVIEVDNGWGGKPIVRSLTSFGVRLAEDLERASAEDE